MLNRLEDGSLVIARRILRDMRVVSGSTATPHLVRRMLGLAALVLAAFAASAEPDPNPPSIVSNQGAWPLRRQWNYAEMQHFAKWIEHIYYMRTDGGDVEQRVAKLDRILTDPQMNLLLDPEFAGKGSNPQLPKGTIRYMNAMVDCAKFTLAMPAYYAYRRGLPWMTSYVTPVQGDIRISPNNIPVGFVSSFQCSSPQHFFEVAMTAYSSGNYRVEPGSKNSSWSDTVPVAVNRKYLLPGCINYVDGHSLILAKVDEYGELYFINASTDATKNIFTYNGLNAVSGIEPFKSDHSENPMKGCFQGLRVFRFPICETNAKGHVTKVRRRTDTEMEEFGMSYEQYSKVGEMVDTQKIMEDGFKLGSVHEFIRYRMKTVDKIVPMQFMQKYVDTMVQMWEGREVFVQDAWREVKQNGPIVYPEELKDENIFQAKGRWETWSSPSSDVDRRNKYFYLADWMDNAIRWYETMPHLIDLAGFETYGIKTTADFASAIIQEKRKLFVEKSIEYADSTGNKVRLTLADLESRLYDLSFDPNHPPELRWGAPADSPERAAVKEMSTPVPGGTRIPMAEAYRLQTYYRTLCQRETEMSCLRGMFTTGFPIRSKFDEQLAVKWLPDGALEKLASTK